MNFISSPEPKSFTLKDAMRSILSPALRCPRAAGARRRGSRLRAARPSAGLGRHSPTASRNGASRLAHRHRSARWRRGWPAGPGSNRAGDDAPADDLGLVHHPTAADVRAGRAGRDVDLGDVRPGRSSRPSGRRAGNSSRRKPSAKQRRAANAIAIVIFLMRYVMSVFLLSANG